MSELCQKVFSQNSIVRTPNMLSQALYRISLYAYATPPPFPAGFHIDMCTMIF